MKSNEAAIPKNTVTPPRTGIGSRWSFRALGLSTILCFFANQITIGYILLDTKNAIIMLNIATVIFMTYP